jgi:hypothetical protein
MLLEQKILTICKFTTFSFFGGSIGLIVELQRASFSFRKRLEKDNELILVVRKVDLPMPIK